LAKLIKDFEPYRNLWITTSDWLKWQDMWMNDPISSIDAENIEKNVSDSYKAMHKAIKQFQDFESKLILKIIR
jgi:dynein heavy chain